MALTSELGFDAGDSIYHGTVLLAQDELAECLLEKRVGVFNHTWDDFMFLGNINKCW